MVKCNYHTHTYRCQHASGTDEEYVKKAIENGIKVLGFSDHVAWNYKSDYISGMRMPISQMADYVASIKNLKEKYQDDIEILIGAESEYYPDYIDELKNLIRDYELDYLIFGNHFYLTDERNNSYYGRNCNDDFYLEEYLKGVKEGLNTGLYSYLCHPDLFMRPRDHFDEKCTYVSHEICKYAKENDVLLEFNLEGMRMCDAGFNVRYPNSDFWKIASKYQNKAIIGFDAHKPESLGTNVYYDKALEILKDLNIEVVSELPRKF